MPAPPEDLDLLFPLPSRPPSVLSPNAPAGITSESAETLVRLLKDNHVRYHCYFNERGFHNHLGHHILAAYYLGATPKLLEEAYQYQAKTLKPAIKSPSAIDESNWKDHLGNEIYYDAYLTFFSKELLKNGMEATFQRYIFAPDANWGATEDSHPQMISRFLAGLIHPFIFLGYGVEFGLLGMVAEGLAQTTVHNVRTSNLLSREFLHDSANPESLAGTLAKKLSLKSDKSASPFAILARMQIDPRLTLSKPDEDRFFDTIITNQGHIIQEYASLWEADTSTSEAVSKRIEEISWVVSLMYGVGGYKKGRHFKADFFLMHAVTSSLFMPSILVHLTSEAQRLLLRSFFAVCLGYWVSQGRPKLDIREFYEGTSATPPIPGPHPEPNPATLSKDNLSPNAWFPVLQSVTVHPNEHLIKLERAFAHYASLYGTSPKGRFSADELPGAEILDGTLFIRAAWLSMERCGWVREGGDNDVFWDFDGFYDDQS